ncbi:MAG TPA: response regulator transcription factor [Acidobacteriota bacterium]|nr:response regulator transcription factor [Acidobacteriota bacterium]
MGKSRGLSKVFVENSSTSNKRVRILIADDHEVVRHGLRMILQSQDGWEICGEASDGREAVALAKELKPNIVVLDISMPELNGLDATAQIVKALPQTEVLILTVHQSDQLEQEAVANGANGYVVKSHAVRDLVPAVQALLQHRTYFVSAEAKPDGNGCESVLPSKGNNHRGLTPRQVEIVKLLAAGKNNAEVALLLGISVKTAETHRANVMRRLGVHSISDLARYAMRSNLIEP